MSDEEDDFHSADEVNDIVVLSFWRVWCLHPRLRRLLTVACIDVVFEMYNFWLNRVVACAVTRSFRTAVGAGGRVMMLFKPH